MNPLISVVINCRNGEEFLREAIDSVYAQTYQNWEIVFWDNYSTDNTKSIARSYDKKLTYFKAPELTNLHKARNLAITKCKGTAVAFLDADDIWMADKLEKQVKLFCEGNSFVYGGYKDIDEFGNATGPSQTDCPSGFITSNLLRKNTISVGSVLIDIELIKRFGFDEAFEIMGDFDLWVRLSKTISMKGIPEIVELSRQHGSNDSNMRKNRWLLERRYFYKNFLKANSFFQFPAIIGYIIKTEVKGLINAR